MSVEETKNIAAPAPIHRAEGVTTAERHLKRLADRSFLSLWSYSGVHRDQGHNAKGGDGKEICDLLVVFENHVIIFSDKDCAFPNTGNLELDWSRWFKRAIQKSAEQIWGAERWIKSYPGRLFLDHACTQIFPLDLPDPATASFHRVVVAHDETRRSHKEIGSSGSLVILPSIVGDDHYTDRGQASSRLPSGRSIPQRGTCTCSTIRALVSSWARSTRSRIS